MEMLLSPVGLCFARQAYIRGAKCHLALGDARAAETLLEQPPVAADSEIRAEVCSMALWLIFPRVSR